MTLRHLRVFLAVCDHDNNLTRTAEALYVAQPSVSLCIRELEAHYGVRLFDRISRRLYLTEAGETFYRYARHIVSLCDDLEKGLFGSEGRATIQVGSSITIGSQLLPAYVQAFREQRPQVDVRVTVDTSNHLLRRLLRNEMDCALVESRVDDPRLISQTFLTDALTVVCPADGRYADGTVMPHTEFLNGRILLRERGSGTREIFDHVLGAHGLAVEPVWESISTTALLRAAACGLGYAVVSRRAAADAIARGTVVGVQVEGLDFTRSFRMVRHKDKFLTPALQEFMTLCMEFPVHQTASVDPPAGMRV